MQKNVCAICLQAVDLDTDILQQNDDIKCVHYTCLNQSQVGQRILAQASYEDQTHEHKKLCKTSFLRLSKRPAFRKLPPLKHSFTLGCTPRSGKSILYPVQECSVGREVYTKTSKRFSKICFSSGSTKWFSSMRKHSYRIMPLFVRNKGFLRKGQQYELPRNKQEVETTVFPFTINASDVYSSEILDWLASQKENKLPKAILEKPMPIPQPEVDNSKQFKKKVTIQESRDPYLTEHKNRDYRKSLPRRASRRRREIPMISIGSQYSNHSSRLNAADFMEWVTSAPKIPNGNMLILLDCRNKKDTQNISVQPSFDERERNTDRKTAESLILDLLDGRKINQHYEYYHGPGSSVTLVKTCTTESRITTSLEEGDNFRQVSGMEEPRYTYPETVEERMHHVISIVFNALGHISGFLGRLTKVMKEEFSSDEKNMNFETNPKCNPND